MAKKRPTTEPEQEPMMIEAVAEPAKGLRRFSGMLRTSDEFALTAKRAAAAYDQTIGEFMDAEVLPILKALWYNRTRQQLAEAKRLAEQVSIRYTGEHPMLFGDAHRNPGEIVQTNMEQALQCIKLGIAEIVGDENEFGDLTADDILPRKFVRMLETRRVANILRHAGERVELNEVHADSLVKYGRAEYAD